ncbi:MAG: DUF2937 family protein [Alphaproteobacteria bacterium]|nr:DUF2937 family protein [Alphaproteobacteria bacterium]
MRWSLRKCDALLGTVLAAVVGLCFAQLPAFMQQYLQRLGGHVDEAQLSLTQITNGETVRALDAPTLQVLSVSLEQRVSVLEAGEQAIRGASASVRPFVFLREFDADIATATLRAFEPALPLSTAGLIYALTGIVAGWLVYELIKTPLGLLARRRARALVPERIEPK